MLEKVQRHINQSLPFLNNSKLLIAVSGGIDSMVLSDICVKLKLDFCIAHCNFSLRDKESDADQQFIEDYAKSNNIKLFVTRFDTIGFAADNKVSVQVAARQLRYLWFDELLNKNGIDYLLTAHHLDDSLETFIINLSRGTGLDGLTGIPQQNGNIIRPLLPFNRKDIENYAHENNIAWREDSSNASDKYLRNKIRHTIAPEIKKLNDSFDTSFYNSLLSLQQSQSLATDGAVLVYKQVVTDNNNKKYIDINQLKRLPNYKAYLYEWLKGFGFTAWDDIYRLVDAQSGKAVYSGNFRLLKDRDIFILEAVKREQQDQDIYEINSGTTEILNPLHIKITPVNKITKTGNNSVIFVDAEKIKFPLFVRKRQDGDVFYPLGMNGLKKKVSKYFKDEKLSLSDKEDTWLLSTVNEVVWIINKRPDERFKVTDTTTQILKIEVL